MQEILGEEIE